MSNEDRLIMQIKAAHRLIDGDEIQHEDAIKFKNWSRVAFLSARIGGEKAMKAIFEAKEKEGK